jgi:parallel beta-helix repeat protein
MRKTIPFLCIVALVLALAQPASATSGTLMISTDTTLTEDHFGSVVIDADSVILDCAGFSVIGPGDLPDGIRMDGHSSVAISNCDVSGFVRGFVLASSSGNQLVGNGATGNSVGYDLIEGSSDNELVGDSASENANQGFVLESGANSNVLRGDSSVGNGGNGFGVNQGSTGNTLTMNQATGNDASGFWIQGSSNTFEQNWAIESRLAGFSLQADGNVLEKNVAQRNGLDEGYSGIDVLGASNNLLQANSIVGNGDNGFYIDQASTGNTFRANRANANPGSGFTILGSKNGFQENISTGNGGNGFGVNQGSTGNTLTMNQATGNDASGFWIQGSSNTFEQNWAIESRLAGFSLQADGNVLEKNVAQRNGLDEGYSGIDVLGASNNLLQANSIVGNGDNGFYIDQASTGNTFRANRANANPGSGFTILGSSDGNVFTRNQANANGDSGFRAERSSGNLFEANQAMVNTRWGFGLSLGASHNSVLTNIACRNGIVDAYDDGSGIGNTWEGNTFCTTDIA